MLEKRAIKNEVRRVVSGKKEWEGRGRGRSKIPDMNSSEALARPGDKNEKKEAGEVEEGEENYPLLWVH